MSGNTVEYKQGQEFNVIEDGTKGFGIPKSFADAIVKEGIAEYLINGKAISGYENKAITPELNKEVEVKEDDVVGEMEQVYIKDVPKNAKVLKGVNIKAGKRGRPKSK